MLYNGILLIVGLVVLTIFAFDGVINNNRIKQLLFTLATVVTAGYTVVTYILGFRDLSFTIRLVFSCLFCLLAVAGFFILVRRNYGAWHRCFQTCDPEERAKLAAYERLVAVLHIDAAATALVNLTAIFWGAAEMGHHLQDAVFAVAIVHTALLPVTLFGTWWATKHEKRRGAIATQVLGAIQPLFSGALLGIAVVRVVAVQVSQEDVGIKRAHTLLYIEWVALAVCQIASRLLSGAFGIQVIRRIDKGKPIVSMLSSSASVEKLGSFRQRSRSISEQRRASIGYGYRASFSTYGPAPPSEDERQPLVINR